jgi:hypothetical protein
MVDRHYSLHLKPWSAGTLYVYAHADLAQKYSIGLQEIFVSGYAPRKKMIFPALWVSKDDLYQVRCFSFS